LRKSRTRVSNFLNSNNILADGQFGFRKNLSTDKALFNFTDEILSTLNNKRHIGEISCDLAKAFDSVNHELLLSKQSFYGIQNIAGQWFISYLLDRNQQVEIKQSDSNNDTYSNWGVIKRGSYSKFNTWSSAFCPYINDLPLTINSQSKLILCADDINIIISHPEVNCFQNAMNDVFASLNKWIKANKLTLNFDKTNFTKFCIYNKNLC
jgi:sarcosine oxidase/L-pipecolate oxidase